MDKSKLNKRALSMAEALMSVRTGLPLSSAIGAVNYKMSNIASQMHTRVDTMSGYSPAIANTYTLLLMNSGGGKNSSLGLLDRFFFGEAFSTIRDKTYPHFKKLALEELEMVGDTRPLHSWTQSISNATMSGIFAYAESFSLCKFGSLNIEIDEIGNAVTSKAELFEALLTPFDNGDFQPVAKRTDSNAMDISGLPVNLYSFGNKVRLFNGDNIEQSFIHLLDEGYGRRFIFIDDTSIPKDKTPKEVLDEMKEAERLRLLKETDRKYINSLINGSNFKKILSFDEDAMYYYATIKADSDAIVNNTRGLEQAVMADLSERHFKTAKLAGVYAFFDGNNCVTGKNMEEAYEVIKESSKVLEELRKVKPLHVRIVDRMLVERDKITAQHMLSYPFINSTWSKKIYEHIDLAKQYATSIGYEWDEFVRDGVTYYMVINETTKNEDIDIF